jgi:hypothetical protein
MSVSATSAWRFRGIGNRGARIIIDAAQALAVGSKQQASAAAAYVGGDSINMAGAGGKTAAA